MRLDRLAIARLVPHAGAMCLLEEVTHWTPTSIACGSAAPDGGHPLARRQVVPAIAAAEYAAQATAVHGALLGGSGVSPAGLLATLVEVDLGSAMRVGGPALAIEAELLSRSPAACLYAFRVRSGASSVASGRLMVALFQEGAS